jgi:Cytochrome c554 and c-prime
VDYEESMNATIRAVFVAMIASAALAQQPSHALVGAGGCESSNCHGGATALPVSQSRILGNEYKTWSVEDKHSRAYKKLTEERAKRMAELLKITDPTTNKRCTVCHVVGSPEKSLSDGVACEACHGAAGDWLGTHIQANSHADSVKRGMMDTKNIQVRAETCLSCHLGAGDRVVDHEMIAAGHPDLAFELDTFTFAQPAHFREAPSSDSSLPGTRAWAVGQSVALSEGMRLLSAHASKAWPEFSDLECYQCHHDLRTDSWRIQRGYGDRKPGSLQVNLARFMVLRDLTAQAAPDQRVALENAMGRLESLVAAHLGDATSIAQAAQNVARIADSLTARFLSQNFDAATTRALKQAITADIQRIADCDVNAAEQATMSLDALSAAIAGGDHRQESIVALYTYLEHPSLYQPSEFAAKFKVAAAQ